MTVKYNALARLEMSANANALSYKAEKIIEKALNAVGNTEVDYDLYTEVKGNNVFVTVDLAQALTRQTIVDQYKKAIEKAFSNSAEFSFAGMSAGRRNFSITLNIDGADAKERASTKEVSVTGIQNPETKQGYVDPDVLADGEKAVQIMQAELKKYSPDKYFTRCYVDSIIYPNSGISIRWAAIPEKEAKSGGVALMNATGGKFSISFLNGSARPMSIGDKFELDLGMTTGSGFKRNGIIWRKISGKSPSECAKKFVMWLKKNEAALMSLGG